MQDNKITSPINFLRSAMGIDRESDKSKMLHRRASIPVNIAIDMFLTLKEQGQCFTRWELFDEVKGQAGSDTLEDTINRSLRKAKRDYHIRCLDKRLGLYEFLGINYGGDEPKQLDLFKAEGVTSTNQEDATPSPDKLKSKTPKTPIKSIPQPSEDCKHSGGES